MKDTRKDKYELITVYFYGRFTYLEQGTELIYFCYLKKVNKA